jgi:hypothetical protein
MLLVVLPSVVLQSVIVLNVILPSVVPLSVGMPSVAAPRQWSLHQGLAVSYSLLVNPF